MLVFLYLYLHFKNYRQLYKKCIHKKGVVAAARSWQSKSSRARMPHHLSLYHCVNLLICVCNCLGTWFSTMWEIARFHREKTPSAQKTTTKASLCGTEGEVMSIWSEWRELTALSVVLCFLYPYLHIHSLGCDTLPWKFCSWCLWWEETRRTKKRGVKDRGHSRQQHLC